MWRPLVHTPHIFQAAVIIVEVLISISDIIGGPYLPVDLNYAK